MVAPGARCDQTLCVQPSPHDFILILLYRHDIECSRLQLLSYFEWGLGFEARWTTRGLLKAAGNELLRSLKRHEGMPLVLSEALFWSKPGLLYSYYITCTTSL